MQSIVLERPFHLEKKGKEIPVRGPREALVRVRNVGICGSDLHGFKGDQPYFTYPRIIGHEFSVEILEIEENRHGLERGDRCVVDPYMACGRCVACRAGKTNCCVSLEVLGVHRDGALQQYMVLPVEKLIRSANLTFEELALVENQCIGAHAVRRADLSKGEIALVVGAGPIGLGVVQHALLMGARVAVMDISGERLAFCRSCLQAGWFIDASKDPVEEIESITSGELAAAVFDATGSVESQKKAIEYTAHGGRIILVGLAKGDISYFHPDFHKRELTLMSSRNATREDFENVILSLENGRTKVKPFITHRTTFDRVAREFEKWLDPGEGVIKAVVEV
jgi:2-desacetyl-2-hydroxyethyl bacteriochlorophyllide A dehydrogenase